MKELRARISELEKAYVEASNATSKSKAEVKYVEKQWGKSAFEIMNNILE